ANPYGATLKWPAFAVDADSAAKAAIPDAASIHAHGGGRATESTGEIGDPVRAPAGRGPTRTVGAAVILVDGAAAAYLARGDRQLLTWLPEAEPQRSRTTRAIARALIERARE